MLKDHWRDDGCPTICPALLIPMGKSPRSVAELPHDGAGHIKVGEGAAGVEKAVISKVGIVSTGLFPKKIQQSAQRC